jgi:flagellar basal-body rod protein FlgB|tara:strand:+ start:585 stop:1010 length:426 start_codon:yes stop_codon:yes gene_type:complete
MLVDKLLFGDRVPLVLKKNLDFQSERNLLISSNITNMNTPGYKAKDLNFKDQLQDAIDLGNQLSVRTTDKNHMGPSKKSLKSLEPDIFEEKDAARSDGNNVNIDKEMIKLSENQIMYNATIQIMAKRGSTLRSAITETAAS